MYTSKKLKQEAEARSSHNVTRSGISDGEIAPARSGSGDHEAEITDTTDNENVDTRRGIKRRWNENEQMRF